MANHKLSLDVPDTLNSCVIRIIDMSVYNSDISIKCPLLQILVPGFTTPQFVDNVAANFSLNLTACQLKVQTANCGTVFNDLPDGIYVIKWSVSPNDVVYVEYNHLRITKALNKIKALLCELDRGACEPPEKTRDKQRFLQDIRNDLDAAKAFVEYCRESKKGLELYKYAIKQLDKMKCSTC